MKGGFLAADVVSTCLHASPAMAERAKRQYQTDVSKSLSRFSWYIYRMTRPAMRDLFMNPRNFFRIQEALLSLLSGDVFGASPIRPRLLLFKAIYFLKSAVLKYTAPPLPRT
jgi:hypothetical protein